MDADKYRYNYDVFTVTFAGTETDFVVNYAGELIYFSSGAITLNIKLNDTNQDKIPITVKESIVAPFKRFFITPSGAGTVTVFLSNPKEIKIESRQVTVDTLSLLSRDDTFRYWTDQQKAFMGGAEVAAVASQYAHVQLLNPAASGKTIYVLTATISTQSNTNLELCSYDTALGTAAPATPKILGGSAGVGLVKSTTNASLLGTFSGVAHLSQNAVSIFDFPMKQAIRLDQGKGLVLRQGVVNTPMNGFFEWIEV